MPEGLTTKENIRTRPQTSDVSAAIRLTTLVEADRRNGSCGGEGDASTNLDCVTRMGYGRRRMLARAVKGTPIYLNDGTG